ncbi:MULTISPECIES: flagellar hook assembly protein FlgD [Pseudomonas]|uniref:Basal-body rod modification protein FlgD n=2 Tax=Pseudomonas gingeri TaxID=117681 RepID=A0A7Y8CF97_9PSED|nr:MULTISPECIES: flagellar hook assembly protein FlgD [Pseudomonas]NVZ29735.1 flagellar hook assembly protein FlgD [Pseudomonas gingeri]NVZ64445.1 flagellar hook assembly protein FlgD [Pseudomonas gingeri]NVZ76563.1 flagellar hook assembly protein FlgD [Pseudomonas gingeri]NWA00630.1 flagellar hook assembly protein FlgD [Pseudomonas gingeri]NWA16327.1 flagellar hook assembly protein FlgD [Pseudomonas gingeri]
MSVSDSTSGPSLNDIINASNQKVANNSNTDPLGNAIGGATGGQTLGKDAFLKLLVTQLKNQNPLDPQDNSAFVAQLAQFSSLEGITTLNTSVNNIAGAFQSSQALQASSLVGRSVIVPTDKAVVDTSKPFTGTVTIPSSVDNLTLKITDSTGKVVRTIDMGSQKAGNAAFAWDGKDDSGTLLANGTYTFNATSQIDSKATAMVTNLPATVSSVSLGQNGGEMMLNLAGLGSIALSKVQTIGL